ncbi:hypothetical protein Tco_0501742 [Tanacetum coccineum]
MRLNNRASTSANHDPIISPAFVEANYEILDYLLMERRKQIRNKDLRTELEYFSEDCDEEREMEPRLVRIRETTPVLYTRVERYFEGGRPSGLGADNNRGQGMNLPPLLAAHLGRSKNGQPLQSSLTSVYGGPQSLINTKGDLPPNGTYLSHNAQPFIPNNLQPPNGLMPTHVNLYSQPHMGVTLEQSLNYLPRAQNGSTGLFTDPSGCVTLFVRWNKDYPLLDGLEMPSHVGSYDRKGDLNNYLHLLEGAICMQKWAMPVACHMFTYTLKDSDRIWWNSQKACSILNYEDLKEKFWSHFSQQNKFTKTHLAVHNIKQREGESTRAFVTRYTDDTLQILGLYEDQHIFGFVHRLRTRNLVEFLSTDLSTTYKGLMEKIYTWIEARDVATNRAPNDRREGIDRSRKNPSSDNNKGQINRDRFSPYYRSNHGMLSNLSKSPREILATEKVTKTFEQAPCLPRSKQSRDMSKYCHFYEDHGHDTNKCRELTHQIKEAVKLGHLAHLVKGIKKGKAKASDTQLGE